MSERRALPGDTVLDGKYRVERAIGMGGFGITYIAESIGLRRVVAVKEYFPADLAQRDETGSVLVRDARDRALFEHMRAGFLKEARALSRFDHPVIVRVMSVFEERGTAYIVMPFESGPSLKAWLRDLGRRPTPSEVERLLVPLLDALEIIHAADYLHRDIAPDNIILRADGSPVLIDFGAARPVMAALTASVTGIVKRGFSPPEQYSTDGRSQGPWTDIYALAATFYQCVTGAAPAEATERMLEDVLRPAAETVRGAYPAEMLEGIDWALRLRPKERPQTIAEWRSALFPERAAVGASPPQAAEADPAPDAPATPPRRPAWVGRKTFVTAAAATAVVVLAGAVMLTARHADPPVTVSLPAPPPASDVATPKPAAEPVKRSEDQPAPAPSAPGEPRSSAPAVTPRVASTESPSPTRSPAPVVAAPPPAVASTGLLVDIPRRIFRDCPTCPEMVVIPAGSFQMGSPSAEVGRREDEGPQRTITIARPFALARTETMRGAWRAFSEATSRPLTKDCRALQFKPELVADYEAGRARADWAADGTFSWERTNYPQDDTHPVACISYGDAEDYLAWLKRKTGAGYRLPSEAEWEYAARAGTTTPFAFGATATPRDASYHHPTAYRPGGETGPWRRGTAPVASFAANAWGLHDMHGNVWEWVADCAGGSLAALDAGGKPRIAATCPSAGMRGGAFWTGPAWMRSAYRYSYQKDRRGAAAGFRAARDIRDDEMAVLRPLLPAPQSR